MTAAAAAPPPRRAPAAPRSLLLAMDGREDAEYDFQAAFAEARRWLEVRRLSVLLGASPSLPRSLPGPGSRLAPHGGARRALPRTAPPAGSGSRDAAPNLGSLWAAADCCF